MSELYTIQDYIPEEEIATERLKEDGVFVVQKAFFTRGYPLKLSISEYKVYLFLCAHMKVESFLSRVKMGELVSFM